MQRPLSRARERNGTDSRQVKRSKSRGGLKRNLPAWENENGREAFQRARQNLRTLHSQIDAIALDCRNRRLRDPRQSSQFALTQLLQLPQDANRLSDGDLDALLRVRQRRGHPVRVVVLDSLAQIALEYG
jgi:hypothetical protein